MLVVAEVFRRSVSFGIGGFMIGGVVHLDGGVIDPCKLICFLQ
jgi:hypothetical protein